MALFYELDVYKKCYSLLLLLYQHVANFSREYKYSLGDKLKAEVLEVMLSIYRANLTEDKSVHIQKGKEGVELLKILLRISRDLRLVSVTQYTELMHQTEDISKQLTAWERWSRRSNRNS